MVACLLSLVPLVLVLLTAGDCCISDTNSYGWMIPDYDLFIKEGDSVESYCIYNSSFPNGDVRNLSFYIDNEPASEPWQVTQINDTTIRLSLDSAQVAPLGHYMITCKLNNLQGVCLHYVYVGYEPMDVNDFDCISHNWERLECTWKEPYNPINTSYKLAYRPSPNTRYRMECPSSTRSLKARNADGSRPGSCTWDRRSSPAYLNAKDVYDFVMIKNNELDATNRTQGLGKLSTYSIVKPAPMINVTAVSVTAKSVQIGWLVPANLKFFQPGLKFKIGYRVRAEWADQTKLVMVNDTDSIQWSSSRLDYQFNISLPYAWTEYNVSIWARSSVANASDGRLWSEVSSAIVQTAAEIPCGPPEALPGSFEKTYTRADQRSVTIRWSELPLQCRNGPKFEYEISWHDAQNNYLDSTYTSNSSVVIRNLDGDRAYRIYVKSSNVQGRSVNNSEIFLPSSSFMPTAPSDILRVTYNDIFFEVQWSPSTPSRSFSMASVNSMARDGETLHWPFITHYTVYWCKSIRDYPVDCQGPLYHQQVDNKTTSLNVTVDEPRMNYQFAVEAHQGRMFGSGLSWSTCIVNAYGNDTQVENPAVLSATNTSLDVAWTLPCAKQSGILEGFKIYYCPVVDDVYDDEEPPCSGRLMTGHASASANQFTLPQLQPYTVYRVAISAVTKYGGEGQSSAPIYNRTAVGVPTAPLDLQANATNTTASLVWREPDSLNGPSVSYKIVGAGNSDTFYTTKAEIPVQCDTSYSLSVTACTAPQLCSVQSHPVSFRTKIGVPGAPGMPTFNTNTEDESLIRISWSPPINSCGPIHNYVLEFYNETLEVPSSYTSKEMDTRVACTPGRKLEVRVKAVNQAETGQLLEGPWSQQNTYPCPTEGLALGTILGISFGVAGFVLIIAGTFLGYRRHKSGLDKARRNRPILPWEDFPNSGGDGRDGLSSKGGKSVAGDKVINSPGNLYGHLPNQPATRGSVVGPPEPMVTTIKGHTAAITQFDQKDVTDCPSSDDRSSGHSSGQHSGSWNQANPEELSNDNDSGAELEPNSPSPDVYINGMTDPFSKSPHCSPGSLSSGRANGDVLSHAPQPYVQIGTAPQVTEPAKSTGYVTIGQSQMAGSPNASPNLSVGSNDSLIAKSERSSPPAKISPVKRNSGYVEAYIAVQDPVCDLRPTASPGYVAAFKSQEPIVNPTSSGSTASSSSSNSSPTGTSSRGYVTLGPANSAGTNASTHYVQMGPQCAHSTSYV